MADPSAADVYVDVLFEDGLLHFVICNDGAVAAEKVRVRFDRPVLGGDGVDLTGLAAFTRLDYLAPAKRLPVYIDTARGYFARRQRSRITITVAWRVGRKAFEATMTHDMRVYADLPHVVRQPDHRRLGHDRPRPN